MEPYTETYVRNAFGLKSFLIMVAAMILGFLAYNYKYFIGLKDFERAVYGECKTKFDAYIKGYTQGSIKIEYPSFWSPALQVDRRPDEDAYILRFHVTSYMPDLFGKMQVGETGVTCRAWKKNGSWFFSVQ